MGHPYDCLVAPAILLDNPGITRGEFAYLLDQTYADGTISYTPQENLFKKKSQSFRFNTGLEGLAHLLRLKRQRAKGEYSYYDNIQYDELGQQYGSYELILPESLESDSYSVEVHRRNLYSKPETVTGFSEYDLTVGSIWHDAIGEREAVVLKIFSEKNGYFADGYPCNEYQMEIRPFQRQIETFTYESKRDLYLDWPEFHPANVYNWNKTHGAFYTDSCMDNRRAFKWYMKDGKYYFDPKSFNVMPMVNNRKMRPYDIGKNRQLGYTDLILTAEAVRMGAWKVLSRHGDQYLDEFLSKCPESYKRYQRAVWDAFVYQDYRKRNLHLTNKEYLDFRRNYRNYSIPEGEGHW